MILLLFILFRINNKEVLIVRSYFHLWQVNIPLLFIISIRLYVILVALIIIQVLLLLVRAKTPALLSRFRLLKKMLATIISAFVTEEIALPLKDLLPDSLRRHIVRRLVLTISVWDDNVVYVQIGLDVLPVVVLRFELPIHFIVCHIIF